MSEFATAVAHDSSQDNGAHLAEAPFANHLKQVKRFHRQRLVFGRSEGDLQTKFARAVRRSARDGPGDGVSLGFSTTLRPI